ncbi:MAG: hypothetical protein ABI895_10085 [Deltaproteobacteria bacterium]
MVASGPLLLIVVASRTLPGAAGSVVVLLLWLQFSAYAQLLDLASRDNALDGAAAT